jgi:ribosome-associated heat shock protein Hsp15
MTTGMTMDRLRIDKWLWAARFYKTRSLAAEEIGKHRVQVNGEIAKASREVKVGDTVSLRQGPVARTVMVRGLSGQRGPAPAAQQLYEETAESLAAQAAARELRRMGTEPALAIEQGRPTKRQRRELDEARQQGQQTQHGWGKRWSASIDDPEPEDDGHQ